MRAKSGRPLAVSEVLTELGLGADSVTLTPFDVDLQEQREAAFGLEFTDPLHWQ